MEPATEGDGLPRFWVEDLQTRVARFEGSFFALSAAVEPDVKLDTPEALLVYLPGVTRDRPTSVLMELEKGGECYEPQLRRLARNFTEGPVPVRLVLVAGGQEVGRPGMAVDKELDRATCTVSADFGEEINVAMILTSDRLSSGDGVTNLRIVAQDPATDAVLGQSEELPVKLGI